MEFKAFITFLVCLFTNAFKLLNTVPVPLQAPGAPKISRKLRFPDYVKMAQSGGKVVSLTHRPFLPPGNTPGTHFC